MISPVDGGQRSQVDRTWTTTFRVDDEGDDDDLIWPGPDRDHHQQRRMRVPSHGNLGDQSPQAFISDHAVITTVFERDHDRLRV